jgi:hypothetical protein
LISSQATVYILVMLLYIAFEDSIKELGLGSTRVKLKIEEPKLSSIHHGIVNAY